MVFLFNISLLINFENLLTNYLILLLTIYFLYIMFLIIIIKF